eukprot:TRINITY_DN17245_c0_g1_i2.p1 TRINITY_DN17245_c0_g1~~TRINITY_DN17245_c0_g1_i2.p1  ORF type:complete len:1286 (+),score=304.56 TRINITY_DN17245_c0_g1_i2:123-3980(+)
MDMVCSGHWGRSGLPQPRGRTKLWPVRAAPADLPIESECQAKLRGYRRVVEMRTVAAGVGSSYSVVPPLPPGPARPRSLNARRARFGKTVLSMPGFGGSSSSTSRPHTVGDAPSYAAIRAASPDSRDVPLPPHLLGLPAEQASVDSSAAASVRSLRIDETAWAVQTWVNAVVARFGVVDEKGGAMSEESLSSCEVTARGCAKWLAMQCNTRKGAFQAVGDLEKACRDLGILENESAEVARRIWAALSTHGSLPVQLLFRCLSERMQYALDNREDICSVELLEASQHELPVEESRDSLQNRSTSASRSQSHSLGAQGVDLHFPDLDISSISQKAFMRELLSSLKMNSMPEPLVALLSITLVVRPGANAGVLVAEIRGNERSTIEFWRRVQAIPVKVLGCTAVAVEPGKELPPRPKRGAAKLHDSSVCTTAAEISQQETLAGGATTNDAYPTERLSQADEIPDELSKKVEDGSAVDDNELTIEPEAMPPTEMRLSRFLDQIRSDFTTPVQDVSGTDQQQVVLEGKVPLPEKLPEKLDAGPQGAGNAADEEVEEPEPIIPAFQPVSDEYNDKVNHVCTMRYVQRRILSSVMAAEKRLARTYCRRVVAWHCRYGMTKFGADPEVALWDGKTSPSAVAIQFKCVIHNILYDELLQKPSLHNALRRVLKEAIAVHAAKNPGLPVKLALHKDEGNMSVSASFQPQLTFSTRQDFNKFHYELSQTKTLGVHVIRALRGLANLQSVCARNVIFVSQIVFSKILDKNCEETADLPEEEETEPACLEPSDELVFLEEPPPTPLEAEAMCVSAEAVEDVLHGLGQEPGPAWFPQALQLEERPATAPAALASAELAALAGGPMPSSRGEELPGGTVATVATVEARAAEDLGVAKTYLPLDEQLSPRSGPTVDVILAGPVSPAAASCSSVGSPLREVAETVAQDITRIPLEGNFFSELLNEEGSAIASSVVEQTEVKSFAGGCAPADAVPAYVSAIICKALVRSIGRCAGRGHDEDEDESAGSDVEDDKPARGAPCRCGGTLARVAVPNDGWACDGRFEWDGCKSGITNYFQTDGLDRFECRRCDYDLCTKCHHRLLRLGHHCSSSDEEGHDFLILQSPPPRTPPSTPPSHGFGPLEDRPWAPAPLERSPSPPTDEEHPIPMRRALSCSSTKTAGSLPTIREEEEDEVRNFHSSEDKDASTPAEKPPRLPWQDSEDSAAAAAVAVGSEMVATSSKASKTSMPSSGGSGGKKGSFVTRLRRSVSGGMAMVGLLKGNRKSKEGRELTGSPGEAEAAEAPSA